MKTLAQADRHDVQYGFRAALFLTMLICLTLLANYGSTGAAFVLIPLVFCARKAWAAATIFSVFMVAKLSYDYYAETPSFYTTYNFLQSALIREVFTLFLALQAFVAGFYMFNKRFISNISEWLIITLAVCNIAVHDITHQILFYATFDNPQIISLYLLFTLITFSKNRFAVGLSLLIVMLMNARLGSSFTSIAVIIMIISFLFRVFNANKVSIPWRATFFVLLGIFAFSSLLAQYVNLRAEGNNGFTRAMLASTAMQVIKGNNVLGAPFGFPLVPFKTIQILSWTQYTLDVKDEAYNIYFLSFHNSLLYLVVRFGVAASLIVGAALAFCPRRGVPSQIIFTALVLLGMSANVVLESARAGPGAAFVLGSLFGTGYMVLPFARRRQRRGADRIVPAFGRSAQDPQRS